MLVRYRKRLLGIAVLGLALGLGTVVGLGMALHARGLATFNTEADLGPVVPPAADPLSPALAAWETAVHDLLPPYDPIPLGAVFSTESHAESINFNFWLEVGPGTPKPKVLQFWDTHRARALVLANLLRDPKFKLGVLPLEGEYSVPQVQRSLLDVALTMQLGARCDDDPTPWLDGFDGLVNALQPVNTRLQGLFAIEMSRLRDQAYLTAILLNRLEAARQARWCAEPARQRMWLATGLDGERALIAIPALRPQIDCNLFSCLWQANTGDSLWARWKAWCNFPGIGTAIIKAQRNCAEGLRGDTAWTWDSRDLKGIGGRSVLFELSNTALSAETFHRLARLGAAVVDWQRQRGELPADGTALATIAPGLGAEVAGQLRLRYLRLAPGRFRIAIDPSSPFPPFADAQRFAWHELPVTLQGLYHYAVELDFPVQALDANAGAAAR